ncbi:MAG: SDR family NAD(P)-dependent oxidoreductase [bacterium]|nr:SDR family NAD(P)-dependent oxidoreductase [bacterium]
MSRIRFDERVALVTGAGNGLGREHALLLAARGARVLVNDYGGDTVGRGRSEAPAEAVVREIEAAGGEAVANAGSVAESADGAAMVEQALDLWGRIDVVVHNAGIGGGTGPFEDVRDEHVDAVFKTHLYGAIHVLRPAWRHMKASGYGRIVNTSSSTALGVDGSFDYPAAKAGLLGLTRSLAREGATLGIKVNAIMPLAYTRMAAGVPNKEIRDWMSATFPAHRVAPLVAWLCHEDVPVSGDIFTVGGGRAARVTTNVYPGYRADDDRPESFRDHWDEVMAGGDPQIALDGTTDAAMMDPGFGALSSDSMKAD